MTDRVEQLKAALSDRYAIEKELGAGGMATVYLAHDVKHDRKVAVKVLRPELAAALGGERFLREIKTTANLRHPHILPLYDSGEADGFLYYVMPLVEGESLRDRLTREKQLPLEDAIRIAREVADALSYAHSHDVVHRDIKPENILLESGHAVVADFGIARAISAAGGESLTQTGLAVGTSHYMSPEQASAGAVDGRSDLYSLGCVVYEMLAGQPPFTGPTHEAVLRQHLTLDPPAVTSLRPAVPDRVAGVLARVLAKTPADRFSPAAEFADALQQAVTTEMAVGPVPGRQANGWWKIAPALVLVAGLVIAGWWITTRIVSGASGPPKSIAVLPLENLTNDPEQEYIADGMTEALIAELAQLQGLRVISRTSVMQYKGVQKPVPVIAQELGVDAIIAGTVLAADGRVRITAQLIQAKPEQHLWADTYDAEFRDILQVHSDVARAVAAGIELELSENQEDRFARTRALDPDAYDAYLRARFHLNKRTVEGLETAVHHFERAVTEDPEYAQAYAGLADAYTLLGIYNRLRPREAYPRAREAALRALELDSRLAESHAALAHVKWLYDWEWEAAEREYRRAIALNPGYEIAHQFYGWYLSLTGRVEEGIVEVLRARELDPLSLIINTDVGVAYLQAGQFDEAIQQLEATLEMDPDFAVAHQTLATVYYRLGRFEKAREHLLWGNRIVGGAGAFIFIDASLAEVYIVEGRVSDAQPIIADFERRMDQEYIPAYLLAGLYGALGDKDRAFEWLERAYEERSTSLMLHSRHLMESLRDDPRYMDVLRRMNLPD